MSTFRPVRISDLGRVVTGRTPPAASPSEFDGDIPFVTPTDIDGASRFVTTERAVSAAWDSQQGRISLPARAVCVVCIGATIGKICMTSTRSQSNQQINSVVVHEAFDPFFVYYKLSTLKNILRQRATGAATPIINKSAFSDIVVEVPPLHEQRRITSILSAYDDLIEVNRRRVAILEEMARRLFEEWFVHLRFPGHEVSSVHDTSQALLPEGWSKPSLERLMTVVRGCSYKGADIVETGGQPFVTLKSVLRDGGYRTDGLKRFSGPHKKQQTVNEGDIVVAVTDMTQERRIIGRPARIPRFDRPDAVFSMDLIKAIPNVGVTPTYLYCWLRYSGVGEEAAQYANGVNVLHLSPTAMLALRSLLPSLAVQSQFERFAQDLLIGADRLTETNIKLASARDFLLPRLVSGELSVAHAPTRERALEAAD